MHSPIRLVWLTFLGFAASLVFGLGAGAIVYVVSGMADAQEFLAMYLDRFNMLVSTGLIAGTAFVVGYSQNVIPEIIEAAFTAGELATTDYYEHKERFESVGRTVAFASEMIVIGLTVFWLCQFPLSGVAKVLLVIGGCAQWALASYVGRKLRYAGMMLHSLLSIDVRRNLFRKRELDVVNAAVHVATTMTVAFIYLHIRSFYYGPFEYDGFFNESARVFLLLPAVIATPVLVIFNFFPRVVLRKIYDKSIDVELAILQQELQDGKLNAFERRRKLMDFDKLYHDELRYSLQLTLSDLPIGATILIMLLQPLLKK